MGDRKGNDVDPGRTGPRGRPVMSGGFQVFPKDPMPVKWRRVTGVSTAELIESEGDLMKDRLTSVLLGLNVLFRQVFQEQGEEDLVGREAAVSAEGVPKGKESADSPYQEIGRISQKLSDQVSVTKALMSSVKKKDLDVQELKRRLETATAVKYDVDSEEMKRHLDLEKFVVKELSKQLDQLSAKNKELNHEMECLERSRAKSMKKLKSILDDFIALCFQLPPMEAGSPLHQLFKDFRSKTDQLWGGIKLHVTAALDVAMDEDARYQIISDDEEELKETAHGRKRINGKITANLRQLREVKMKLKEFEEEIRKERAEGELTETSMRKEIAYLQKKAKEEEDWGRDSSLKIAESMEVVVRQLERNGRELFEEKVKKEEEIAELSQEVDGYRQLVQQLTDEADSLRRKAEEEAAASVEQEMGELKEEHEKLARAVQTLEKSNEKAEAERERVGEEFKLKATEADQLKRENAYLKSTNEENSQKLAELQRKAEEYEAQLQGHQFSMPVRPSDPDLVARHLGRLPESSALRSDPLTQSLPYGGARPDVMSASFSAYGRSRPFDSAVGRGSSRGGLTAGEYSLASRMRSQTTSRPAAQQFIQCLKCSRQFPISEVDDYERHIRQCYGVGLK